MRRARAAGAFALVSLLLLAALPAPAAPAAPATGSGGDTAEASAEQLRAVSQAMGDEPEVVEGGTTTAPATDGAGFGALIARVVGVLAFILGLLYVSLLGMKKVMSRNQAAVGGQIQVLGRTPLSQKANVYLLRFRDRYLIVGEAGERLTSLASMPAGESPEIEDGDAEFGDRGGLVDIFSTAAEEDGAEAEDDRVMARVGEGVKKLRQETENLLKIHMGVPGRGAGTS